MKFEQNLNTLVNDVMSSRPSSTIVYAPDGTGKADFLNELASRYGHVFWFDAAEYDVNFLPYLMIERVVADDDEFRLKLMQLTYCRSEYNRTEFVLRAISDYASRIKGNCLFVFEHMEQVEENELGHCLLESLILHCPPNAKIILSASKFLKLSYQKFEPNYPKLIDETQLTMPAFPAPKNYLAELSRDDIGFLIYVSVLPSIEAGFAREIYADGERLLRYLSRKRSYVSMREANAFRMNQGLRTYLQSIEKDYRDVLLSWNEMGAMERCGDYMYRNKRNLMAFFYYQQAGSVAKCDRAINALMMQKDSKILYALYDYLIANSGKLDRYEALEGQENYPYYRIFVGLRAFAMGKVKEALTVLEGVLDYFRGKDNRTFFQCASYYSRMLIQTGEREKAVEFVRKVCQDYENTYPEYVDSLICSQILVARELVDSLADLEKRISAPESAKQYWYVLALQELAKGYADVANYRKVAMLTDRIKQYLPYYVVAHDLLSYRYYLGEADLGESVLSEALDFAEKNGIHKNIGALYMALARIDAFYGRISMANRHADQAVEADEREKEKNVGMWLDHIAERCFIRARNHEIDYAKEVLGLYLKYSESFAPQCAGGILLALSCCSLYEEDREKSYYYATKSMTCSKQRSPVWLAATAIVTAYRMNRRDLKDAATLVRNILKHAYHYGMDMVIVDYYAEIFDKLVEYARQEEIESQFLAKIDELNYRKLHNLPHNTDLVVNFFGDISIRVADQEVQWKTRKSKELFLHYLLAGSAGIDRNVIIEILWKDYLYESAINNLKTTNNLIRKTLEKYGVEFRLEYANSKYSLEVTGLSSDLETYHNLMSKFNREQDSPRQVETMDQLLEVYQDEFASDLHYEVFDDERKSLRQEMVIALLRLVRFLARQKEFMEAKKYLSALTKVDKQGDYSAMAAEIDGHINVTE